MTTQPCWCGQPNREQCCAPVLNASASARQHLSAGPNSTLQKAATPEALMRARYSAYVTGNTEFLMQSWHPDTRPSEIRLDPAQRWLGLSIKDAPPAIGKCGEVEFVARFKIAGRGHRLHERSRFVLHEGHWLYFDGELLESR